MPRSARSSRAARRSASPRCCARASRTGAPRWCCSAAAPSTWRCTGASSAARTPTCWPSARLQRQGRKRSAKQQRRIMPEITLLAEAELRSLLKLDRDIVACIEDAFRALATKAVVMPPILHLEIAEANGEIDVKTAYVPGLDVLAMKMSPGFFDNPKIGLPSLNGLKPATASC